MPDPITFTPASPRYALPLLFPGQSQKEFYVNEAHALIDALLHPAVAGEANDPPTAPADGECWLVGAEPTELWKDHAAELACWSSGGWLFVAPREGMCLLNQSTGQMGLYRAGEWAWATPPSLPAGGSTVDSQARAAIADLVAALAASGIFPG